MSDEGSVRSVPARGTSRPGDAGRWRRIAHGTPLGSRPDSSAVPAATSPERASPRCAVALIASITTIDPIRDRTSGELYYDSCEGEELLNVSRRGACLRVQRPPEDGTRVLLRLKPPGSRAPVDLVARTRWSRVEYRPGEHGARAAAIVGLEVIGGSPEALDRYESGIAELLEPGSARLAAPEASG